jgi:hypothetical protein
MTNTVLNVLYVVLGPLAGIWALNTLFHLNIEYNIETWVAVFVIVGLLRPNIVNVSKQRVVDNKPAD